MDLPSTIDLLEKLREAHQQNQLAEAQQQQANLRHEETRENVAKAQRALAKSVKEN